MTHLTTWMPLLWHDCCFVNGSLQVVAVGIENQGHAVPPCMALGQEAGRSTGSHGFAQQTCSKGFSGMVKIMDRYTGLPWLRLSYGGFIEQFVMASLMSATSSRNPS